MKILYTSDDVRKELTSIFESSNGRRVAISAFVGEGAEVYITKLQNLELYCWPKPGATNPDTLRRMMQNHAKLFFSDRLHMKVYWTEDRGAILTSANLSTNALGSGNLKEIGIKINSDEINIERLIKSLNSRPVTEKELRKLDVEPRTYLVNNLFSNSSKCPSFEEWYSFPWRKDWKLALINGECEVALATKKILQEKYHRSKKQVDNVNMFSAPKNYKKYDWVLIIKKTPKRLKVYWLYIDDVVEVAKSDKKAFDKENPYQFFQVYSDKYYSNKPFDEKNSLFKKALSMAIKQYFPKNLYDTANPPDQFVDSIYQNLRKGSD